MDRSSLGMIVNGVALKAHSAPGRVENTKTSTEYGVEKADARTVAAHLKIYFGTGIPAVAFANECGCSDAEGPCSCPPNVVVG